MALFELVKVLATWVLWVCLQEMVVVLVMVTTLLKYSSPNLGRILNCQTTLDLAFSPEGPFS